MNATEKITFWYGCNAVRHGDIIHGAIALLEAVGVEVTPAGGAGYCCGTSKDANLRAAEGMGQRTVKKFNAHGTGKVVSWCPSCYRHMNGFMGEYTQPQFELSHFTQLLHARRDVLAQKLTRRVERKVMLHRHFGFHEVDVNPLVEDLLRLVPGITLLEGGTAAPGHMCSALSRVPASLKDVTRGLCDDAAACGADTVATVFHSCQRLLCGLEASEPFRVVNYVSLLTESMGLTFADDYKAWKLAGSEDEVIAKVGEERIAAIGENLFRESILPELMRRPSK
ncbi:MAG: (Fe-S)-binding protein [Betaproteobacteria bacterium]|nr:(Fe-S)-binding protein [Betaproteobacteria bacterium]